MKARSRPTSVRAAPRPAAAPMPWPPTDAAAATPFAAFEAWFRRATAGSQAQVLELADRQGFLSLHQLPPISGGVERDAEGEANLLTQLLVGQNAPLPFVTLPAAADASHEAVARARATHDVCLWQRGADDRRSAGLIAGVLRQAARSGQRVLVLEALTDETFFLAAYGPQPSPENPRVPL